MDALPEELAELFRGLEIKLLQEICSRLKISGGLNEVTVQSIRALRSHGIDLDEIKRTIDETTNIGAEKLDALLDDVVERNQKYYSQLVTIADVTAPARLVDENDIAAIRRQTWAAYRNITGSMGFLTRKGGRLVMLEPARVYQRVLDNAIMQVESGAISYNQAISEAVRELADSGLCVAYDENGNIIQNRVQYERKEGQRRGHIDHIDVAVRRAVLSSVNQLNQKYREQSTDYLNTDLVQVSAHLGARNIQRPGEPDFVRHDLWQGKIFKWNR